MDKSPVISDVKREVYGQAEAAIGRFFDGRISAEELADSCRSLSGRLMDACKDRGYPMPLWGGMMGPAFQETFYGEFRRMVLDEAVNRFLKNLQVYPGGYFSRFPQLGALSMNPRA